MLDIFLTVYRAVATQKNNYNWSNLLIILFVVDRAVRGHELILSPISVHVKIVNERIANGFALNIELIVFEIALRTDVFDFDFTGLFF